MQGDESVEGADALLSRRRGLQGFERAVPAVRVREVVVPLVSRDDRFETGAVVGRHLAQALQPAEGRCRLVPCVVYAHQLPDERGESSAVARDLRLAGVALRDRAVVVARLGDLGQAANGGRGEGVQVDGPFVGARSCRAVVEAQPVEVAQCTQAGGARLFAAGLAGPFEHVAQFDPRFGLRQASDQLVGGLGVPRVEREAALPGESCRLVVLEHLFLQVCDLAGQLCPCGVAICECDAPLEDRNALAVAAEPSQRLVELRRHRGVGRRHEHGAFQVLDGALVVVALATQLCRFEQGGEIGRAGAPDDPLERQQESGPVAGPPFDVGREQVDAGVLGHQLAGASEPRPCRGGTVEALELKAAGHQCDLAALVLGICQLEAPIQQIGQQGPLLAALRVLDQGIDGVRVAWVIGQGEAKALGCAAVLLEWALEHPAQRDQRMGPVGAALPIDDSLPQACGVAGTPLGIARPGESRQRVELVLVDCKRPLEAS